MDAAGDLAFAEQALADALRAVGAEPDAVTVRRISDKVVEAQTTLTAAGVPVPVVARTNVYVQEERASLRALRARTVYQRRAITELDATPADAEWTLQHLARVEQKGSSNKAAVETSLIDASGYRTRTINENEFRQLLEQNLEKAADQLAALRARPDVFAVERTAERRPGAGMPGATLDL